jgi:hypothetical protein
MLVLTTAALAEIAAGRRDTLRRSLQDSKQARAAKPLLDLGQLRLHRFPGRDKRNKDHEIVHPPHAIAAEGDVVNGHTHRLARRGLGSFHNFLKPQP